MKTGIKSQIVIVSAVAAVLLIVMSVCAIAESITFEKVAALTASALSKRTYLKQMLRHPVKLRRKNHEE